MTPAEERGRGSCSAKPGGAEDGRGVGGGDGSFPRWCGRRVAEIAEAGDRIVRLPPPPPPPGLGVDKRADPSSPVDDGGLGAAFTALAEAGREGGLFDNLRGRQGIRLDVAASTVNAADEGMYL